MNKTLSVTKNQTDYIHKMARDKGVSREAFQRLLDKGVFARILDSAKPVAQQIAVFLRQLYTDLVMGTIDATTTFRSAGFYMYYVAPGYRTATSPTPAVSATVYELVKDATWMQIFGAFGEYRPRWKTEAQIVAFCRDHRDKLRQGGYATFFELEGGFVARVRVGGSGELEVSVGPLGDVRVWSTDHQHRIVVPQQ